MNKKERAAIVMGDVCLAVSDLQKCRDFSRLMPEVRVNIVYALPGAKSSREVAAIDGRITVVNGLPHASGLPGWGVSDHMARMIIEARRCNKDVSAGINFKCDKLIMAVVKAYAAKKGLKYGWIDRTTEPDSAASVDGQSIPWKMKYLVKRYGAVPDLFYEGDGWGKEPLFFALGADPHSVVKTVKEIAAEYRKKYPVGAD
jgi:thiamine-phosphate diphosphorylase